MKRVLLSIGNPLHVRELVSEQQFVCVCVCVCVCVIYIYPLQVRELLSEQQHVCVCECVSVCVCVCVCVCVVCVYTHCTCENFCRSSSVAKSAEKRILELLKRVKTGAVRKLSGD